MRLSLLLLLFYSDLPALWRCSRITALLAVISCSIPCRVGIFYKEFIPKTRKDDEAEPLSLVIVPNVYELNPKSVRSADGVKAYELLIATHPSDGDVKQSCPIGTFNKV